MFCKKSHNDRLVKAAAGWWFSVAKLSHNQQKNKYRYFKLDTTPRAQERSDMPSEIMDISLIADLTEYPFPIILPRALFLLKIEYDVTSKSPKYSESFMSLFIL